MKKAILSLAVVAAVALVSCNNKAKEEAAEAPADSIVEEATLVEETAVVVDSAAATVDTAKVDTVKK